MCACACIVCICVWLTKHVCAFEWLALWCHFFVHLFSCASVFHTLAYNLFGCVSGIPQFSSNVTNWRIFFMKNWLLWNARCKPAPNKYVSLTRSKSSHVVVIGLFVSRVSVHVMCVTFYREHFSMKRSRGSSQRMCT